jgi:hypothetical protein
MIVLYDPTISIHEGSSTLRMTRETLFQAS